MGGRQTPLEKYQAVGIMDWMKMGQRKDPLAFAAAVIPLAWLLSKLVEAEFIALILLELGLFQALTFLSALVLQAAIVKPHHLTHD